MADHLVTYLRDLGHQHNPTIRSMFTGMDEADWDSLSISSPKGQALLASYQMMMEVPFESAVRSAHGRAAHYDGLLGPATSEIFMVERCGMPDYVPSEDAATTGNGSWRPGCLAEFPDIHAIGYHVDFRNCPQSTKDAWDEIDGDVNAAYAEVGLKWVPVDSTSQAQVRVSFENLPGSTIGLAQLPPLSDAEACYIGFFCKLDPNYKPNTTQIKKLLAHEKGHNCKSQHKAGDPIMDPTIQSGPWNGSFLGTAFGNELSRFFGGEPIEPDFPDPPPPAPDPKGEVLITGTLEAIYRGPDRIIEDGDSLGEYLVARRP